MHIGVVAPPWIPVPPPAYGGTEAVIASLVKGLSGRGVEVTLFAHRDTTVPVNVLWAGAPDTGIHMGDTMTELAWGAAADVALRDCDVVHHHTFAGVVTSTERPMVLTNHGPFEHRSADLVRLVAAKAHLVAISHSHAEDAPVPVSVVNHGVEIDQFPVGCGSGGYLMFLGRMDPTKGAHRAIEVARRAGMRLVIAAKMRDPHERQYFRDLIAPELGDDVVFVKEPARRAVLDLLADAVALVNPIEWREPFGMVMIEAQACGTPVLAFGHGAAPELIVHGSTGFISGSVDEMVADVARAVDLSRGTVRSHIATSFSAERMVDDYMQLYLQVCARPDARLREVV